MVEWLVIFTMLCVYDTIAVVLRGFRSQVQTLCGWTISYFMQGCVTPLECFQYEYGPPEWLHKSRMSLCLLRAVCHHMRAIVVVQCLYYLLLNVLVLRVKCTSHIINYLLLKRSLFSRFWKTRVYCGQ